MKKYWLAGFSLLLMIILARGAPGAPLDLQILYVNDFHGFAEPHKPFGEKRLLGGIAYLAGAVDRARRGNPSLLLAAGDMIQGEAWANLLKGKSVIELMNAMHFDAMVVGNHEFDYGLKVLKERIAQAHFPMLAANVRGLPALKPYVILPVQNLKIAIIGVVTRQTMAGHPGLKGKLKITPPAEALRQYLPELKRQADLILVLSHCGYPVDRELAAQVPGIDVIVGGHTHTKILHPQVVDHTIIVQAWEHAKALGILRLTISEGKIVKFNGHLEEISPAMGSPDPRVQQIVARYARQFAPRFNKVVGQARVNLNAADIRTAETNLGDFIADVMRQATGAEAAIISGGTIKASIPRGPIKTRQVYQVLPYDRRLVVVQLTGAQLKEALEHGVSHAGRPAHRFPQVAGLTFTYRPGAPPGSRVLEVTVDGRPLELHRKYKVAITDYLAAGGNGYEVIGQALKQGGKISGAGQGPDLRNAVIAAIQARKTIGPEVAGRIKVAD
jgi:5'-nucleotidase/UDP-sugar diphosphatase